MRRLRRVRTGWLALLIPLAMIAGACGETTTETTVTTVATTAPTTGAPATTAAPVTTAAVEPVEIAYLSASAANTWLSTSKAEMERVAAEAGFKITEFDAQFDPESQIKQLQDVVASGRYDGIIVAAVFGEGLIPDLQAALDAGIKVVLLNQVVGSDLTTPDPQVDGISASVLAPPLRSGERYGELTLQACEGLDPCRVVYLYGIKGIPLDNALKEGFDSVIAANPKIQIVAEGEGKWLGPEQGITAMQDIMQATPEFDVVVGSDQSIQGVEIVLTDAGILEKVKLIGLGGSQPALNGIAEGRWFAGVFGAPGTEGRLAMEAMVDAIINGIDRGGIDPLTVLPDEGLVTQENVDKFTPEWAG